jgi:hypothetical protein
VFSEKSSTITAANSCLQKFTAKEIIVISGDMITASYAVQLNWARLRIETPGLLYRNSADTVYRICSF